MFHKNEKLLIQTYQNIYTKGIMTMFSIESREPLELCWTSNVAAKDRTLNTFRKINIKLSPTS